MVDTTRDGQTKTDHVHRTLLAAYGEPTWCPNLAPVSKLVSTILSQNTNNFNRDVAYDRRRLQHPLLHQGHRPSTARPRISRSRFRSGAAEI